MTTPVAASRDCVNASSREVIHVGATDVVKNIAEGGGSKNRNPQTDLDHASSDQPCSLQGHHETRSIGSAPTNDNGASDTKDYQGLDGNGGNDDDPPAKKPKAKRGRGRPKKTEHADTPCADPFEDVAQQISEIPANRRIQAKEHAADEIGKDRRLKPSEQKIGCWLARRTNFQVGSWFCSFNEIAKENGCSRSTAIRSIDNLERYGTIVARRHPDARRQNKANSYAVPLLLSVLKADEKAPEISNSEAGDLVSEKSNPCVKEFDNLVSNNSGLVSENSDPSIILTPRSVTGDTPLSERTKEKKEEDSISLRSIESKKPEGQEIVDVPFLEVETIDKPKPTDLPSQGELIPIAPSEQLPARASEVADEVIAEAVKVWNEVPAKAGCAPCEKLTNKRKRLIAVALCNLGSMEAWRGHCGRIAADPWESGQIAARGNYDEPHRCDINRACDEDLIVKLLEKQRAHAVHQGCDVQPWQGQRGSGEVASGRGQAGNVELSALEELCQSFSFRFQYENSEGKKLRAKQLREQIVDRGVDIADEEFEAVRKSMEKLDRSIEIEISHVVTNVTAFDRERKRHAKAIDTSNHLETVKNFYDEMEQADDAFRSGLKSDSLNAPGQSDRFREYCTKYHMHRSSSSATEFADPELRAWLEQNMPHLAGLMWGLFHQGNCERTDEGVELRFSDYLEIDTDTELRGEDKILVWPKPKPKQS